MINLDKNYHDYTSIDTDKFLEATLGEDIGLESIAPKVDIGNWIMESEEEIEAALNKHGEFFTRSEVMNVYNDENDFSSVFQFCVFYPRSESDWLYASDCFVAVEQHLGGDVRGNYGNIQVFRVDCIAETGFLDWMVGWYVEPLEDFSEYNQTSVSFKFPHGLAYNDKLDSIMGLESDFDAIETINERCSVGYSSNPTCELREHLSEESPEYSEALGCYIAKLPGGALVKLHPSVNVPY